MEKRTRTKPRPVDEAPKILRGEAVPASATSLESHEEVELALIDVDGSNPRARPKPADVRELADSIATHGLFHPLTVAADGKRFRLVAGHRRLEALRLLGWKAAPCRQYYGPEGDGADLDVRAARIVENDQREPLDPIAESRAVCELLGAGLQPVDVGRRLGRSAEWVNRRARLARLAPEVHAALGTGDSELARWPVAWLEDLASTTHETQVDLVTGLVDGGEVLATRDDLQQAIFRRSAQLERAPWNLDDAELVPDCGACSACPKRSALSPGLFDLVDRKGGKDRCLDSACYSVKTTAWVRRSVDAAKEKHGAKVVVVHGEPVGHDHEELRAPGKKALATWEYKAAKAGAKGAVPAVVIDGKGQGSVRFVVPAPKRGRRMGASSTPAPKKPVPPEQLAELEVLLRATAECRRILADVKTPDGDALLVLIAAFPYELGDPWVAKSRGRGDTREARLAASPATARAQLWKALCGALQDDLHQPSKYYPHGSHEWARDVRDTAGEAEVLAGFFDGLAPKDAPTFNWPSLLEHARAAIAKAKKPTAEEKAAAAKKAGSKGAKKPAPAKKVARARRGAA